MSTLDRRQFLKAAGWTTGAVLAAGCAKQAPRPRFRRHRKSNPDAIDAPTRYGYQLRKKAGREPTAAQKAANNSYNMRHRRTYTPPPKP